MECPICGGKAGVYDTASGRSVVIRKRRCGSCGHAFCTKETYADRVMEAKRIFNELKYAGRRTSNGKTDTEG